MSLIKTEECPIVRPYYEHAGITLYHGDCRGILPALAIEADLVFADPPFGIDYRGHGASKDGRANHFAAIAGDSAVDTSWLGLCLPRAGGAIYLKTTWSVLNEWEAALVEHCELRSRIIWDKCSHTAGDVLGGYAAQSEIILFAAMGRHRIQRFDTNIWRIPRATLGAPEKRTGHPYESPVSLPARAIENSSQVGDLVLDPFAGSGSTLIAAKELGRRAIGIELEERYCEIIARRLAQETLFSALPVTPCVTNAAPQRDLFSELL